MLSEIFFIFLVPSLSFADQAKESYLRHLISISREKELSNRIEWIRLVHYQKNILSSGLHSLADDPNFFNSQDGRTDPKAELEATLSAFFAPPPKDVDAQHPQCAFPARFHWLNSELNFNPELLPVEPCPRFEEWISALNPHSATLVFPSAYLNNPASMFGHTLLRIDGKGQDEATRLLAYGASYSAATNEVSGIIFAYKGIFGGYKGVFSIAPYYKQVKSYSDLENRDIWEYELSLSEEEVLQLLRHLWELSAVYFDYYFFDENCSYHLLSLLEVARPGLSLADKFPLWAIPADTVRVVAASPGLVQKVVYRPASRSLVLDRMKRLSKVNLELAKVLATGELSIENAEISKLPQYEQAKVLELAFDYLSYRLSTGEEESEDAPKIGRELLLRRSQIKADIKPDNIAPPQVRPDEGHHTARLNLAVGVERDRFFSQYEFRPAYHDLLDPEPGYTPGAGISFFDLAVRHEEEEGFQLQEFTALKIQSLSTRDEYFSPKSWNLRFGMKRETVPNFLYGKPVWELGGGAGRAYGGEGLPLFFAFLQSSTKSSFDYEDDYALGMGVKLGFFYDWSLLWRTAFEGISLRYALGEEHSENDLNLTNRIIIGENTAIRVAVSREERFKESKMIGSLSWQWYF